MSDKESAFAMPNQRPDEEKPMVYEEYKDELEALERPNSPIILVQIVELSLEKRLLVSVAGDGTIRKREYEIHDEAVKGAEYMAKVWKLQQRGFDDSIITGHDRLVFTWM